LSTELQYGSGPTFGNPRTPLTYVRSGVAAVAAGRGADDAGAGVIVTAPAAAFSQLQTAPVSAVSRPTGPAVAKQLRRLFQLATHLFASLLGASGGIADCIHTYIHTYCGNVAVLFGVGDNAVVTTTIRLRFHGRSTAYQISLRSQ